MGFIINRADLILKNFFHNKIKSFNITREQWGILSWLYDCDGINQKELAKETFKDPAALTKTLNRMEKKDLIKRVKDENDKRAFLIYLTDTGRKLRNEIEPIAVEILEEAFHNFTEEEVETLKNLLKKLSV